MDWKLALVSLITVPLLFAATNWFANAPASVLTKCERAPPNSTLFCRNIFRERKPSAFNAEAKAQKNFHDINDDYRNANIETIYYYAIFYPMVDFIGAIGVALVIWFGGYQILTGVSASGTALTIGTVIAFIQYSQQLFQPIRDLSDKFNVLQAAIVASHRIFLLLDLPIEIKTPEKPKKSGKVSAISNFKMSGLHIKKIIGF
jgi:ATP-binding cassette subfamily B protein